MPATALVPSSVLTRAPNPHKASFLIAASLLMACAGSAQPKADPPGDRLTLSDAERILGQPAHRTDSITTREGDVLTYRCTYTANVEEEGTGRMGAIYFLLEEHSEVGSAHAKYTLIKKANEDHEGIQVLDGLGDEAYFHSDGENFLFIMARKGTMVLSMKVNKVTRATSRDAFNEIAKRIVDAL